MKDKIYNIKLSTRQVAQLQSLLKYGYNSYIKHAKPMKEETEAAFLELTYIIKEQTK